MTDTIEHLNNDDELSTLQVDALPETPVVNDVEPDPLKAPVLFDINNVRLLNNFQFNEDEEFVPFNDYGFLESAKAGFGQENLGAQLLRYDNLNKRRMAIEDDPDYTYIADIQIVEFENFDQYESAFVDSNSSAETQLIIEDIKERVHRREIIEDGNGWGAGLGMLAAGVLSPEIFIPVIGVARALNTGRKIAGVAAKNTGIFGAAAAVREGVILDIDPIRTIEEAAFNVIAESLTVGLLSGGAFALLNKSSNDVEGVLSVALKESQHPVNIDSTVDDVDILTGNKKVDDVIDEDPEVLDSRSVGAAEADGLVEAGFIDTRTMDAPVNEKAVKWLGVSVNARLATSAAGVVIRTIHAMQHLPFLTNRQAGGDARKISWREMNALEDARLESVLVGNKTNFNMYKKRMKEEGQPAMNHETFNSAIRNVMNKSDVVGENIPVEVLASAKLFRKNFDDVGKMGLKAGLFGDNITTLEVKHAAGYIPRNYNIDKILDNHAAFKEQLTKQIGESTKGKNIKPDELEEIVNDIISNITKRDKGDLPTNIMSNPSALKGRVLEIDDEFLNEWMIGDVETLYSNYHRSIITRSNEEKAFGGVKFNDIIKKVNEEYDGLLKAGKLTAREVNKLASRDIKDLEMLRRSILGQLNDVDRGLRIGGGTDRFLTTGKDLMRQAKLGGMTISAIPDIGRLIMVDGMMPFLSLIKELTFNTSFSKLVLSEKRELAAALEVIQNRRANAITDVEKTQANVSGFERGVEGLGNKFINATLMNRWNSLGKTMVAVLGESKMQKIATKLASGKLSKTEIGKWANMGMGVEDAVRISKQYKKHGKNEGGLFLANFDKWDNVEDVINVKRVLKTMSEHYIITPNPGDLPTFFNNRILSTIFQFKSFVFAANDRMLIPALQKMDFDTAMGMITMVGLGGVVVELKDQLRMASGGKEIKRTNAEYMIESVDRSGIISLMFEVGNWASVLSNGNISLDALKGKGRYRNRTNAQAILGPLLGSTIDMAQVISKMAAPDAFGSSDIHKTWSNIPFQNLFYTKFITDRIRDGLKEYVD